VIAYVDSSVALRLALSQPGALAEWHAIDEGVTSALTEVECLRTLDRLRLREGLDDEEVAVRRESLYTLFATVSVVDMSRPVLDRAAQPLPTSLGTLDAIHLATAQLWRERSAPGLVMATHDTALALAARAIGMTVVGVPSPHTP
jgi:predicted nucleic acid-binding protein